MSDDYIISIYNRIQLSIIDLDYEIISYQVIHGNSSTVFFLFVIHESDIFISRTIPSIKNISLEI